MSTPACRQALLAVVALTLGVLTACSSDPGSGGAPGSGPEAEGAAPSFTADLLPPFPTFAETLRGDTPVELADGNAMSVGTVDGAFVVQWRDPEGTGWSEPEPLGGDQTGLVADSLDVAVGGSTVLLTARWQPGAEAGASRPPSTIVCRDLACDVAVEDPSSEASLSADGEVALVEREAPDDRYDLTDTTYDVAVWRADDGDWRPLQVEAPPYSRLSRRPFLVLMSDGALATVRGADGPRGCRFDLLVSDPLAASEAEESSVALERVASRSMPDDDSCVVLGPTPGTREDSSEPRTLFFSTLGVSGALGFTRSGGEWAATGPPGD